MHPRCISSLVCAAALLTVTPVTTLGSGAYCACLPKPPVTTGATGAVDRDMFDLGQKVFNGKTAAVQGDAAAQRSRLEALQARLPAKVAKKKNLTALAGRISTEQLQALEYFVEHRYPQAQ